MNDKRYRTFGKRRSHRLKDFDYSQPYYTYHVIIGTRDKRPVLVDSSLNDDIVDAIKKSREIYAYCVIVYSVMPDHLHLLVQAKDKCTSLPSFIGALKSFTTKVYRRHGGSGKLWQRGFYEHILRGDENVTEVAEYILDNSIRKGLVDKREEYRWADYLDPPIR